MLFNSLVFIIFISITFVIYYIIKDKYKPYVLLFASFIFILSYSISALLIGCVLTIVSYGLAFCLKDKNKAILGISIIIVGGIFFIKYLNYFMKLFESIMGRVQILITMPQIDIIIPVGISFYTLKIVSYLIDVYKGKVEPEKNLGFYSLYVLFFPQFTSGPIERADFFITQIKDRLYTFEYEKVRYGLILIMVGLLQKVVLADRLNIYVNYVYSDLWNYHGVTLLMVSILYTFQIYCDFASYSTISIGCAKLFGYNTQPNFNKPYLSKSIKEFWTRWHISFSSWLKDYVYIPLGGNRKGKVRQYLNLALTFIVSGIWHGTGSHFLLWGGCHAFFQIVGNATQNFRNAFWSKLNLDDKSRIRRGVSTFITFIFINISWILFRVNSLYDLKVFVKQIFQFGFSGEPFQEVASIMILGNEDFIILLCGLGIMITLELLDYRKNLYVRFNDLNGWLRWSIYAIAFIVFITFGIYGPGFDSQSFIYTQF